MGQLGLTVRGTVGFYTSLRDMLSQDLKVPKCHVVHMDREGQGTILQGMDTRYIGCKPNFTEYIFSQFLFINKSMETHKEVK